MKKEGCILGAKQHVARGRELKASHDATVAIDRGRDNTHIVVSGEAIVASFDELCPKLPSNLMQVEWMLFADVDGGNAALSVVSRRVVTEDGGKGLEIDVVTLLQDEPRFLEFHREVADEGTERSIDELAKGIGSEVTEIFIRAYIDAIAYGFDGAHDGVFGQGDGCPLVAVEGQETFLGGEIDDTIRALCTAPYL